MAEIGARLVSRVEQNRTSCSRKKKNEALAKKTGPAQNGYHRRYEGWTHQLPHERHQHSIIGMFCDCGRDQIIRPCSVLEVSTLVEPHNRQGITIFAVG